MRNNCAPHDIIEFFQKSQAGISEELAALYRKGLSMRDIEAQTGIAKTTVRKLLLKEGVEIRPKVSDSLVQRWRSPGKRGIRPIYGFTYFDGKIVKHQKEYPILLLIHRLWKKGDTATSIAHALNGKGYPSRMGKKWSWNAVNGIVDRFQSGVLVLDEVESGVAIASKKVIRKKDKEK
jgi:hypothetical protein